MNSIRQRRKQSFRASELQSFINIVEQHAKNSVFPPKERNEARLYMAITDLHSELVHVLRATKS